MQLKYGTSYSFDVNSVMITSRLETRVNAGGQPFAQTRHYHVTGYLSGDGQVALTQAENALKTALSVPFRDLALFNDDGSLSSEILLNAGSLTGVIVRNLEFPKSEGPEYATLRSFAFDASAEYPMNGTLSLLLSFTESISFSGGGPLYIHRPSLNALPQKQMTWRFTPYRATQRGEAVGYRAWPKPPPPRWGYALKQTPSITPTSPTRKGLPGQYAEYKLTWAYEFEDARPLVGNPTLWIS